MLEAFSENTETVYVYTSVEVFKKVSRFTPEYITSFIIS